MKPILLIWYTLKISKLSKKHNVEIDETTYCRFEAIQTIKNATGLLNNKDLYPVSENPTGVLNYKNGEG